MEGFALLIPGSGGLGSFAALCGILAGLIMIIPAVGTTLSMFPPLIVGALTLHKERARFAAGPVAWRVNADLSRMQTEESSGSGV
jgi:predicted PurR-regulated permease PerM